MSDVAASKRAADASRAATCPTHLCPPAERVAESSRTPSNLPNAPLPARGATCDLPTLQSRRATRPMHVCPPAKLHAGASHAPSKLPHDRPRCDLRTFLARRESCPMHFCPLANRSADASRAPSNLPNAPLTAREAICGRSTRTEQSAPCTPARPWRYLRTPGARRGRVHNAPYAQCIIAHHGAGVLSGLIAKTLPFQIIKEIDVSRFWKATFC